MKPLIQEHQVTAALREKETSSPSPAAAGTADHVLLYRSDPSTALQGGSSTARDGEGKITQARDRDKLPTSQSAAGWQPLGYLPPASSAP